MARQPCRSGLTTCGKPCAMCLSNCLKHQRDSLCLAVAKADSPTMFTRKTCPRQRVRTTTRLPKRPPFLAALHAKHRVYRWDARGHGGHADDPLTPPTAERMARDLHNLGKNGLEQQFREISKNLGLTVKGSGCSPNESPEMRCNPSQT